MRVMATAISVVLCLPFLFLPAWGEDYEGRDRLKLEISEQLFEQMGEELVTDLTNAGLAEVDAEQIVDRFADDVAECALIAVEKIIVDRGESPEELLRDAMPKELGRFFRDGDALEQAMTFCVTTAASKAGLEVS